MAEAILYIRHLGLWLLLATTLGCSSVQASAVDQCSDEPPSGVFGTVEFRGSLKALPNWQQIVAVAPEQFIQFSTSGDDQQIKAAKDWQRLAITLINIPVKQQLIGVNSFFNRWPYRLDQEVWQRKDYWATPMEFMRRSGDCEDYAISKYFALRYLGLSADQLRIVILRDTIRSITHAVLDVYVDDDILILDNLSNPVFSHRRYQHYLPQYSVNEQHRWMHIKPCRRRAYQETSTGD